MDNAPQGGDAEEGFKARTGTLTLLFMTSAVPPERLLELLERALHGGLLGPPDDSLSPEERKAVEEAELEAYLAEDEPADDEDEGPVATLDAAPSDDPDEPVYRTSAKGAKVVYIASVLQRWLRACPQGPLELGAESGEALSSLICCWSATVIHALAREPLTLTELDRAVIPIEDRDIVEEHVEAMERVGHVKALPGGGETRYALTDWLREGIAPIIAAARMEIQHPEKDVAPPDILDVEAAFQLALPLLQFQPDLYGTCRLGVQIPGGAPLMAGATVNIDKGCVVSSSPLLAEDPENFATGSPLDWCDTVVDPRAGRLKAGGDPRLTGALIEGLHERLFGTT